MAFDNFVKGLSIDNKVLKRQLQRSEPLTCRYVILFTGRSGSSWICSVLKESEHLGIPWEYLNPKVITKQAPKMGADGPRLYLKGLGIKRKTTNGVFGMKVTPGQIRNFGRGVFFNVLDESTTIFNLWRENIVAQAISSFRATKTRRFHSKLTEVEPPTYDAAEIRRWVSRIRRLENETLELLDDLGRSYIPIKYEDCAAMGRSGVINLFAKSLEVDVPTEKITAPDSPKEYKKIADEWNKESEARFRESNRVFLEEIEATRLARVRHTQPTSESFVVRPLVNETAKVTSDDKASALLTV